MSWRPLPIFTTRLYADPWISVLDRRASKPIAVTRLSQYEKHRARFMVPYLSDFGGFSLYIDKWIYDDDVHCLIEQAKDDKFRAVYLLDGKQDVMLFRNKYCERLTPEYVMSAPIEELESLKWAGSAENVGTLTMTPVGV